MKLIHRLFGAQARAFMIFLAMVAAYVLLALAVSTRRFDEIFSLDALTALPGVVSIPIIGFTLWIALLAVFRRSQSPTRLIGRKLRRDRYWILRSTLMLMLIIVIASGAFMALKVAIPRLNPYYADPYLAAIDRFIMFGHDPWAVSHAVLGQGLMPTVDILYSLWFTLLSAVSLWAAFDRNPRFQMQASFAYLLTWMLLGNVLATLLASVGPIFYAEFYGDPAFAALITNLEAAPRTMMIRQYLLDNYSSEALGSGISAAPSLHVAITNLLLLMCYRRFRFGIPTLLAALYLVVILVGSVHLGWHYLTDGLIAMILTPLIWKASGWLVRTLETRQNSGTKGELA